MRANKKTRHRVNSGHSRKAELVLAVDIGGTKVEAGLVSLQGEIICTERKPMIAKSSASDGLRAVRDALAGAMHHGRAGEVRAIGVSVPGWIDTETGKVLKAANLPCWRNYPLAQKLQKIYGVPVRVQNDANAAALAEAKWGAGRRYDSFFYVSLGTGIGTGILRQGSLHNGHRSSSEGGHMTINYKGPKCPCGKRGCVEMYASGRALARRANFLLAKRGTKTSLLAQLAKANSGKLNAELVGRAAIGRDTLATQILEETCDHLAVWLGNIVDLIEPEAIVFGGGLGPLMHSYASRIRQRLKTLAIHPRRNEIHIVSARFGSHSALLGAAALWLQE